MQCGGSAILLPKARVSRRRIRERVTVKATSLSKVYWRAAIFMCPDVASRVVLTASSHQVLAEHPLAMPSFMQRNAMRAIIDFGRMLSRRSSAETRRSQNCRQKHGTLTSNNEGKAGGSRKKGESRYPSSNEQVEAPYKDDNVEIEVLDGVHDDIQVKHG